jgi:hypothetical protein
MQCGFVDYIIKLTDRAKGSNRGDAGKLISALGTLVSGLR